MGYFDMTGKITQLPITGNDRVAAILCKVRSITELAGHKVTGDYELQPMCPILYGSYDGYGSINPDKSPIVDILEKFFRADIEAILSNFSTITTFSCTDMEFHNLHNLVDKRSYFDLGFRESKMKIPETEEEKCDFITNNFCLVLEHEQIVKDLITEHDALRNASYGYLTRDMPEWDPLYDKQLEFFKNKNLDVYTPTEELDPKEFLKKIETMSSEEIKKEFDKLPLSKWNPDLTKEIQEMVEDNILLFPVYRHLLFHGPTVYHIDSEGLMDLFVNYESMFKYNFDSSIKKEYLETLKFADALRKSNLRMFIDKEPGSQWQNVRLWKKLIPTYSKIIDAQLEEIERQERELLEDEE